MTVDEFKKLVALLKVYFPRDNFIADGYAFNAWYSMLKDLSYEKCSKAVQAYVQTNKYPPTVADIREMANTVSSAHEMDGLQAWSLVSKALRNGTYHSVEEFEKLPPLVQKAVGSADNIRNWSQADYEAIETVIQSNFLRAYNTVIKRESEVARMNPHMQLEYRNVNAQLDTKQKTMAIEEKDYSTREDSVPCPVDKMEKLRKLLGDKA